MGACYNSGTVQGNANNRDRVESAIVKVIHSDMEECICAYSGNFGTKIEDGIEFLDDIFESDSEAEKHLMEKAVKHGPILVCRILCRDNSHWYYAGICPT